MADDVILTGCSPVPLASYLKALGVLRIVAEQLNRDVRGCWRGESFALLGTLGGDGLRDFFLNAYQPSPIVGPWNGGSGFYPKDNRTALDAIVGGASPRFAPVRAAIGAGRDVVAAFQLDASPKAETKAAFLAAVRGGFLDDALAWIDAAVLLGGEDPRYPPLLGTGGIDGRLDFTNNFLQRLVELFDPDTGAARPDRVPLLEGALFGAPVPGLMDRAIGQFAPGNAGGPNAATGFSGTSVVNPWDFVLALEGALLLTAAATRRLESALGGALSYPFTVRPTGSGSGASQMCDEQAARGEIWLPVWMQPATHREIASLFREGRATVGRRAAADGFDFRRAVASLGVDRGIDSFVRYSFAMRLGRAYLATPLGRVRVASEPRDALLVELDRRGWLDSLRRVARRKECPAALRAAVRGLEEDVFALLRTGLQRRLAVQNVLIRLAEIERLVGASRFAREDARLRPLARLSAAWALEADDGAHEFRLAAALAGLVSHPCPFRAHAAAVCASDRFGWRVPDWQPNSSLFTFDANVAAVAATLHARLLADETLSARAAKAAARARRREATKARDALDGRCRADRAALAAFVRGDVDERRLASLATGLALARMPRELGRRQHSRGASAGVPAAVAALVIAFTPPRLLSYLKILPADAKLARQRRIIALLAADRIDEAVAVAWQSLRLAGMRLPPTPPRAPAAAVLPGARIAAALLFPIDPAGVRRLARRLLAPVEAGATTGERK